MQEERPSKTAFRVALRRAVHQVLDEPRVFDDPLALPILGVEAEELLNDSRSQRQTSRALRAFMAVRSRYAEDGLAAAFAAGTRQYLILGAGLDTFACRNPFPGLRVFEVDHPATQTLKHHRLEAAGIPVPESLTFAPIDFEHQTLAEGLAQAGFQTDQKTFVSCLGVIPYLTRSAALATFRFVASLPAGSEIVFDYALSPESLGLVQRLALKALAERVAAAGEPFQTFFDPSDLRDGLRRLGFGYLEEMGADDLNARYFAGRTDGLKVSGGLGRMMKARVG